MFHWELVFNHEESVASDNLISLFIVVEWEKRKMKYPLDINGLFSAAQYEGYQPIFTCSCGTFGCGGYYMSVSHLEKGITFRNLYKPVDAPTEADLIEALEYELSWEDLYFMISEVYEKLAWLTEQYPDYDVCSGTFGPGVLGNMGRYELIMKEVQGKYED